MEAASFVGDVLRWSCFDFCRIRKTWERSSDVFWSGSFKMGYCFVGDVLRRLKSGEKECWYFSVDRDSMGIDNR